MLQLASWTAAICHASAWKCRNCILWSQLAYTIDPQQQQYVWAGLSSNILLLINCRGS